MCKFKHLLAKKVLAIDPLTMVRAGYIALPLAAEHMSATLYYISLQEVVTVRCYVARKSLAPHRYAFAKTKLLQKPF